VFETGSSLIDARWQIKDSVVADFVIRGAHQ
jgi:hypothetical protein